MNMYNRLKRMLATIFVAEETSPFWFEEPKVVVFPVVDDFPVVVFPVVDDVVFPVVDDVPVVVVPVVPVPVVVV